MALKKQLTNSYVINVTITAVELKTFFVDINTQLIHIGYSTLMTDGTAYQDDIPLTLSDADYTAYIARLNELGATLSGAQAHVQAALEFIPGVGTISGSIKTLTTPYVISGTVIGQDLDSFGFNIDDNLVLMTYSLLDSVTTTLLSYLPLVLEGQEYTNFIARLNELELTLSTTDATITACLEALPGDGSIINI